MKKHPMSEVADALRYLASQGYSVTEVYKAVKQHDMSAVEIAEAIKQLKEFDTAQRSGA